MSSTEQDQLSQQILETASGLYLKYGLKKVTMDDISKAVGKSRTSIYYYYKNREEVFQAVLDNLIKEVISEIDLSMNKRKSFEEKINEFCIAKVKTSQERASFFRAIETGMDAEEKSKHMTDAHDRMMEAEKNLLLKVFAKSITDNEIPKVSLKEQETVIFILLSSIRGIRREMVLKNNFKNLNPIVNTLTSMVIRHIS
ncbi:MULTISPECIES: TetR/AcrR family transcriptional regulator [Chryseobacterium]|jgi:AcrR family transcriptional regulator|uniref:TetR/AcrR family transcriptional regulator n=1 Tax=Chryseobacterium rhizosphaerae TaxID=395937 RepID=A0ABX9IJT6_9FLAO|nr:MULTISPECIES: TetR/AcrR family transcriptional regulator [Chryseobacterium]REC74426.1 TetR/AcrR family transcriptional regulator [Chryseobacterium rhizosphaerae]GEN68214.1 TetR family transcriptional regulator [Chryseobacterium rhizosphaerae]SMC45028.1 transcriptional regulator, TetR family [Chryseobacterium sp. YR221]